jgi:LysR family hydrogen peroxide-inducible transcriptional activator
MELDQLNHFLNAAELCSFTRAAEACTLSQSALSRSIARLEEELGQPLFERQTRSVSLTDAGRRLLVRAQQIVDLVEEIKSESADDGQTGTVRVGAIPSIAPFFLPQTLTHFQQAYPQSKAIVHEDTTEQLLKQLSDGVIDVAIAALPIRSKFLKVVELFTEELLLVVAVSHPLSQRKTIRSQDIASETFVLLSEAHCLSESVLAYCQQKSIHPITIERTSQLATVQELVALHHGISFIPEMARRCDTSERRVYRSLSGTKPTRTIVSVTNPYRYESKLQRAFVEQLLSLADCQDRID